MQIFTLKRYPLLLCMVVFLSCEMNDHGKHHHPQNKVSTPNEETQKMIQELDDLAQYGNPMDHYHWNRRRAEHYLSEIPKAPDNQKLSLWYQYNYEMLNAGEEQKVIDEIENFIKQRNIPYADFLNDGSVSILELLALAYLRLGENENCRSNHNPFSCILPLREEAQHQLKTGSEKAAELYTLLYSKYPKEKFKWLVNLAYMTLGDYPGKVPKELLIPFPQMDERAKSFPAFEEKATFLGIAVSGIAGGVCIEDFNNDGLLDLFTTSYWMSDQVRYFENTGLGLIERTEEAGLKGITSGLNCLHADYNNDGWTDIFILRGGWLGAGGNHPNSLLKNQGDGTFTDVTRSSGVYSKHPTQTAVWADVNRDGFLDLFIGNESRNQEHHPCEFYENQGDGTFIEKSADYGLGDILGYVKGVDFGDINNDTWPDLFISVMGGENQLWLNREGHFENIGESAGIVEPIFSFPCWFWDVNQDGLLDIFVSSYDVRYLTEAAEDYARELQNKEVLSNLSALYINNGDLTFTDESAEYGINKSHFAMGANFGDLDNDGFPDFYLGTGAPDFTTVIPNRMYKNLEGKTFVEVTASGRFGHIQKGHGISFADLDQDGDQDIYAVMGGAFEGDVFSNVYFENPIETNNWLVVRLIGTRSNKSALGARLTLDLNNGQRRYHEIGTGGSFGANSLQAEMGLGKATSVRNLTIRWPSGREEEFAGIRANQKIQITEGEGKYVPVSYQKLNWVQKQDKHIHHH